MSRARPVYKGVDLMLTKRVRGRELLLRPSKKTNQIVKYVVAAMAQKWRVEVIAVIAMSNHWHVVLHDPHGAIVDFERDCHAFIARAINAAHGEFDNLWTTTQTSRVRCETTADLIDKIAYVMANPVDALLVRYGHCWPGVRAAWPAKPTLIKRPRWFFSDKWPEQVLFEMKRPPGYAHLSDDELAAKIKEAIFAREEKARERADAEGKRFLGRRAILRQSRHTRATSWTKRFGISPTVAAKDRWRRIERLRANATWHADYDRALERWCAGDRTAVFPYGTYKMHILHGALVAPPD